MIGAIRFYLRKKKSFSLKLEFYRKVISFSIACAVKNKQIKWFNVTLALSGIIPIASNQTI